MTPNEFVFWIKGYLDAQPEVVVDRGAFSKIREVLEKVKVEDSRTVSTLATPNWPPTSMPYFSYINSTEHLPKSLLTEQDEKII